MAVVIAAMPAYTSPAPSGERQTRTRASLWYRGMPAGVPRQVDLDAIGAAGFSAVTWPTLYVSGALDLRRMADRAGLEVVIRTEPVGVTPDTALVGEPYVDIIVPRTPVRLYPTLVWRSVAHGTRVVSFDAGVTEGSGLRDGSGRPSAWADAASALARQLVVNAVMVDTFSAGPSVKIDPAAAGLDVVLIDAGRSWVLVATNAAEAGAAPADTYVYLPKGVPSAEWLNLFDGTTISMLRQPAGPRWHVVLGPGDARLYAIGKIERGLLSLRDLVVHNAERPGRVRAEGFEARQCRRGGRELFLRLAGLDGRTCVVE